MKKIFCLICLLSFTISNSSKATGDCNSTPSFNTGWYVTVEAQGCNGTTCDLLTADSLILIGKVKYGKRQCDKIAADSCILKTCTNPVTTCCARQITPPEVSSSDCYFYTDSLGVLRYRCQKNIDGEYQCVCRVVPRPQVTPSQPPTLICNSPITLTAVSNQMAAEYYQWFLNDTAIVGAENLTYTATQAGTYTFLVMNSDGSLVTSIPLVLSCNTNQIPAASAWSLLLLGLGLLLVIYLAIIKIR